MVLTNTTIETINYVKDLDIEFNIKIILLSMLFIYSTILIYFSFKWDTDQLWQTIIKYFIMRIPSTIFLFFSPFFTIFLFRSASWEIIYGLMIPYFIYIFVVGLLAGKLGLFTMLANLLGIDTTVKKMELKTK